MEDYEVVTMQIQSDSGERYFLLMRIPSDTVQAPDDARCAYIEEAAATRLMRLLQHHAERSRERERAVEAAEAILRGETE